MKWLSILLSLTIVMAGVPTPAQANEKIAGVFLETYLEEQLKKELEGFLNANPELVFSNSATIGSDAMQFVGYALAVYNFLEADTDKQRLFITSGVGMGVAAVPYAGLIMLAVQLADLAVSLDHQKNLAQIYQQAKEYQLRTIEILKQVFTEEFHHQMRIMKALGGAAESITKLHQDLSTDATLSYLKDKKTTPPSTEDVKKTFELIGKLHKQIVNYEVYRMIFAHVVQIEHFEDLSDFDTSIKKFDVSLVRMKSHMDGIKESVRQFYAFAMAQERKQEVVGVTQPRLSEMDIYVRCSSAVNKALSLILINSSNHDSDEHYQNNEVALECLEKYQWEIQL